MSYIPGKSPFDGKDFHAHFDKRFIDAFAAYERDYKELMGIGERLVANAKNIGVEKISDSAKRKKFATVKAQMDKLTEGHSEAVKKLHGEYDKINGEIDEVLEHRVNLLAGICSVGEQSAAERYLLSEVQDFRAAKGNHAKRREYFFQVSSTFGHVAASLTERGPKLPDRSILAEYERISDPEQSSAFYRKNKDVLIGQLQARMDAANHPKA